MPKKNRISGIARVDPESELILKKHVGLIHCENKLTLLQRKICNILLFNALDNIQNSVHELSLRQLCSLIGYKSNDISLIKKSLKNLMSIVMEWNLLDDHKFVKAKECPQEVITWHASTLLAGATIERGKVQYSYSPQIKTILFSLEIYGRINLFVQAKFNSSYSLVLYENCVRFKSIGKTSWLDLTLFRALMGVHPQAYPSFKELKRNVITPALQEINQKSDITVNIEYKRSMSKISAMRFIISENDNYRPSFKRAVKKMVGDKLTENAVPQEFSSPPSQDHLREYKAASQITTLHKKYMFYKFQAYRNYVDKSEHQEEIYAKFQELLQKNAAIDNIFQKKGFESPFVMNEFIQFIETQDRSITHSVLSLDDFVTAEDHEHEKLVQL